MSASDPKFSYDELLKLARQAKEVFRTKAADFVPKMYDALMREGLEPSDAKDRIYKDLVDVWEKDTIRRQLPEEAKDAEKSEAARTINRNRAGKNPAPQQSTNEVDNQDGTKLIQRQAGGAGDKMPKEEKPPQPKLDIPPEVLDYQKELRGKLTEAEMERDRLKGHVNHLDKFSKELEGKVAEKDYRIDQLGEQVSNLLAGVGPAGTGSFKFKIDLRHWGPSLMKAMDDRMEEASIYVANGKIVAIREV